MSAGGNPVTVRFAPSPTGLIHLGNARTALYNWFLAKRNGGGTFILRFDDTDAARSREEFAEAISRDLDWLGVAPDRVEKQSARLDVYARAAETLKEAGVLYACYETPDELERQRRRSRARGLPPVYDRRALLLSPAEKAALEAEGRAPHWRFLLPNFSGDPFAPQRTEIVWNDLVRGRQAIDLSSLSDPVLVRADGTYLYTFTSVADDFDLGITHVVRGDDHVTNTAVQIAIFRALGAEPPVFGHHNLLQGETGEGMSKRDASLSLRSFREEGIEAQAVAAFAALIGTSEPVQPYLTIDEIAARFDFAKVNQAPARFSPPELRALNARLVGELPYEAAAERLKALGVGGGAAFWEAVRGNVPTIAAAVPWWEVVTGPVNPAADEADAPFLAEAAALLPEEPWDGTTWSQWTNALKAASGRRGRDLFLPLRLALTGLSSGPELAALLPLIGRPNTLARLPAPAGPSGR